MLRNLLLYDGMPYQLFGCSPIDGISRLTIKGDSLYSCFSKRAPVAVIMALHTLSAIVILFRHVRARACTAAAFGATFEDVTYVGLLFNLHEVASTNRSLAFPVLPILSITLGCLDGFK